MKILQLSSAQQFGGGERHVIELCRELCARGHEILLVVRPHSPLPALLTGLANLTSRALPLRGAIDLGSAYRLAKLIVANQIELVHCHYARDYPLAALAVWLARRQQSGRQNGLPAFILTRHHYLPMRNNWAYRRLLGNLDYAIAVSTSVANTVRQSFPWPLEPSQARMIPTEPALLNSPARQNLSNYFANSDNSANSVNSTNRSLALSDAGLTKPRVAVIPNWIESTELLLSDATWLQSRRQFGLSEQHYVIGVVNQISAAKGQELVVRAAATLTSQIKELVVVLAGREHEAGAPYSNYLGQLAAQLNVDVRFVGHVKELAALYQALDLVVIPSENEAFSIVCLEAMAARRLVIASAVGGLAELIQPNENGLLFPVGDQTALTQAIKQVVSNQTTTAQMIECAANRLAQRFARSRVIDRIVALYQQALTERQKE